MNTPQTTPELLPTISARRARFLRRRGESLRFHGYTTTGKARYRWIKAAKGVMA